MADETYPIIRFILDDTPIEFSDSDILECSMLLEVNPISAVLPASTVSVKVFTTDPRFSIFSDGEFYNALSKHLPMDIYVEWGSTSPKFLGKYYLDSWKMETENILSFELVDALGVCANIDYPGSYWETDTAFSEVVTEILSRLTITSNFDTDIQDRPIKGWIPPSSVRDALQQVCFAARVEVKTDGISGFRFVDAELPIQADAGTYTYITDSVKTQDQAVEILPQVTDIELISHDYYNLGEAAQTVEEIYSAWLEPGNYIISYPKPYWKVWGEGAGAFPIYVATEDGRVIVTEDSGSTWATARVATESETFMFGSNYVSVNVTVAGQITLWGYPWLSADRPHRHREISDTSNAITIENAMLVNSENATDVLAKIVEYYNLRHQTRVKVFPMYMKLGWLYKIDSFRSKQLLGVGERFEIDLTGGFLTTATFRGMEYIPE
jgi:hypothetical protein